MESTKIILDLHKYIKLNKLGQGNFGVVYLVEDADTHQYYAAKISKEDIEKNERNTKEILNLFREINVMSALNHPSIIHFIGFSPTNFEGLPKPTIITEYASNGTLKDLIKHNCDETIQNSWDDTKKLICIYGIASGMSYLHQNKIIHRDLKPENILMDDFLFPKLTDFGLSKFYVSITESMNLSSMSGYKGTPLYMAPEIITDEEYSEASDVYAFSMILYEIMTGTIPFTKLTPFSIMNKIGKGGRPNIPEEVPDVYVDLIKKCWSQEPEERPTFDQILTDLRSNSEFITEKVDKSDFLDYIECTDKYPISFDFMKNKIKFEDFLKSKNSNLKKINLNKEIKQTSSNDNESDNDNEDILLYPLIDYEFLDDDCKKLVKDAQFSHLKKFVVGRNLIEAAQNFPSNTQLGMKYLQSARLQGSKESVIYLAKMFISGEVVPQDFEEARQILNDIKDDTDADRLVLLGKIERKEKNFSKAREFFQKASKAGNADAMFYIGKMLKKGEDCEKDEKAANKYFDLARRNGCTKTVKQQEEQTEDSSQTAKVKSASENEQQEKVQDKTSTQKEVQEQDKEIEKALEHDKNLEKAPENDKTKDSEKSQVQDKEIEKHQDKTTDYDKAQFQPKELDKAKDQSKLKQQDHDKDLDKSRDRIKSKSKSKEKDSTKDKDRRRKKKTADLSIPPNLSIETIFIGNHMTGKTNTIHMISDENSKYEPHLAIFQYYNLLKEFQGQQIKINIYDLNGDVIDNKCHISNYSQNPDFVSLFFSLTDFSSFENLPFWVKEMRRIFKDPIFFLVATFLDKWNDEDEPEIKKISQEQIDEFAQENGIANVMKISNKDCESIHNLIRKMVEIKIDKLNSENIKSCCIY